MAFAGGWSRFLWTAVVVFSGCTSHGISHGFWPDGGPPLADGGSPSSTDGGILARMADAFVDSIGVNAHLNYAHTVYQRDGGFDSVNAILKGSHIRYVRGPLPNSPLLVQEYNLLASSEGLGFLLICDPSAHPASAVPTAVENVLSAARWLEGPNEPNNFASAEWPGLPKSDWAVNAVGYQRALYAAVTTSMNPAVKGLPILNPPIGYSNPATYLSDVQTFANAGGVAGAFTDGVVHDYPGVGTPDTALLKVAVTQQYVTAGSPIHFASETGYNTATAPRTTGAKGVSEQAQGKLEPRLLLEQFLGGIQHSFLYELLDEDDSALTGQNYQNFWGIARTDGTPKPALTAITNLILLLEDPGALFTPDSLPFTVTVGRNASGAPLRQLLLQKRDGRYFLLLWLNAVSYAYSNVGNNVGADQAIAPAEVTVTLPSRIRTVLSFRPGASLTGTPLTVSLGSLTLSVPDEVIVLELDP